MKKLCVFDLDGTLVDTLTSLWYCGNRALADNGYEGLPKELYKVMVGDGAATLMKRMLARVHGDPDDFEAVFAAYREYFKEGCMYEVKPYPGIVELLGELKKMGVKIAVLSNKPHVQTQRIVKALFGEETFDMILGQREGVPKKPAPDGVLEIMSTFGIKPEEMLYLGDTNTDMKTGNNANAETIGVLWGFREKEELLEYGAFAVVSHPLQVLDYLK